jgi:hypothetical protein
VSIVNTAIEWADMVIVVDADDECDPHDGMTL